MHLKMCDYLKMLLLNILFLHPTHFRSLEKKGLIIKPQEYPSVKCIFQFRKHTNVHI